MIKKLRIPARFWLLLFIFVAALFIRLWQINAVPAGITHDELDYYLGGKFLGLTGSDFTGTWKWWTLSPMNHETITAELTPLFFVPAALLFPNSLFAAKLVPALFSAAIVLVMYGFLFVLSRGNRQVALIGSAIMALNPWSIMYGRTAYEVTISLFWYFLAITLYISPILMRESKRTIMFRLSFSCLALFLGYFTYHGFKFLVPFISLIEVVGYFLLRSHIREHIRHYWWYFLVPLLLSGSLLGFSLWRSSSYGGRSSEISFINISRYTSFTEEQNRQSTTSPFHQYLQNNTTLFAKDALITYFDLFSVSRLFLSAKDGYTLNFPGHGYFYFIELGFVFMGVLQIIRRKSYWVCLLLALVAPIPSAIHVGASYAIRSQLLIIPMVALIAIGINYIFVYHSWRTVSAVVLLYLLSFGYFAYVYIYQNGVRSADQYMLHFRIVSSFIKRSSDAPSLVLTSQPYFLYRSYLFYTNGINQETARPLQQQFKQGLFGRYEIGNLLITDDCKELDNTQDRMVIIDPLHVTGCHDQQNRSSLLRNNLPYMQIESLSDNHAYFKIYNSSVCQNYDVNYIPSIKTLSDFSIEQLSDRDFCQKWMVKK